MGSDGPTALAPRISAIAITASQALDSRRSRAGALWGQAHSESSPSVKLLREGAPAQAVLERRRGQGKDRNMRNEILIAGALGAVAGACASNNAAAQDVSGEAVRSSVDQDGSSATMLVARIEQILQTKGSMSNGVLEMSIARTDIGKVAGPLGATFTPAFEIHGDLHFQMLGRGQALLNADMALREDETNPFIAALLEQGLVLQAFHQHTPMNPQIWFVHFRGIGDPLALARKCRAAIGVTHTPMPQPPPPQNPTSPLDPKQLSDILHGDARVGDEGVVTVTVDRTNLVRIEGLRVSPEAGISTTIEFKPTGGSNAEVVPDFSMTSAEATPVVRRMLLDLHWAQGCLYNQETAESPQLYFDHMVKIGDAYQLAREIRKGLDLTHAD